MSTCLFSNRYNYGASKEQRNIVENKTNTYALSTSSLTFHIFNILTQWIEAFGRGNTSSSPFNPIVVKVQLSRNQNLQLSKLVSGCASVSGPARLPRWCACNVTCVRCVKYGSSYHPCWMRWLDTKEFGQIRLPHVTWYRFKNATGSLILFDHIFAQNSTNVIHKLWRNTFGSTVDFIDICKDHDDISFTVTKISFNWIFI